MVKPERTSPIPRTDRHTPHSCFFPKHGVFTTKENRPLEIASGPFKAGRKEHPSCVEINPQARSSRFST